MKKATRFLLTPRCLKLLVDIRIWVLALRSCCGMVELFGFRLWALAELSASGESLSFLGVTSHVSGCSRVRDFRVGLGVIMGEANALAAVAGECTIEKVEDWHSAILNWCAMACERSERKFNEIFRSLLYCSK